MSEENKISIAVHGGAGPDSELIKQNTKAYEQGLEAALKAGYSILEKSGNATDAVEAAVNILENHPLFNAGRGSSFNHKGEIEMDASIMEGKHLKAGAVSMVKNVKNPVSLAKYLLKNTHHVFLSGNGALELAKNEKIELETDAYFVTAHQYDEFIKERKEKDLQELLKKRVHGTVGAVAVDKYRNVAAATSTGGTTNCLDGRIGDSCVIGGGCYANNNTCAVSGTGDGEYLITGVIAHSVSSAIEYTGISLQQACEHVIFEKNKDIKGEIGVISVNSKGEIGIAFNSKRMHRAWIIGDEPAHVKIYA